MRRRLLWLLLGLMVVGSLALSVPLAISQARSEQQVIFLDRLNDASRFASIARQGLCADEVPISEELRRYAEVYGISAALLDRNGHVQCTSSTGFQPSMDDESSGMVAAALGGRRAEPPPALWPWADSPLVVTEPVIDGGDVTGVIVTSSPTGPARQRVLRHWGLLALGELLVIAVSGVLAFWLARWVLRPVRRVDRVAHDIASGQLAARVPLESGPPELRRLSISFNEMADSVEDVLEQQRRFIADASHQLRNPVNALLLRLDDLAMRLPGAFAADASQAAEDGHDLAVMLEDLLQLASVEHDGHSAAERLDLVVLAKERLATISQAAAARGITLGLGGESTARVLADRVAVTHALDVVLDNAVKFAPERSHVWVTVTSSVGETKIVVVDEGAGLAPDELAQAGRRFWRSRRHQNMPGSGLGLSIASTMLKHSGAQLTLDADLGKGLRATLHVPAGAGVEFGIATPARYGLTE